MHERTHEGLDVHALAVVACAICGQTNEIFRGRRGWGPPRKYSPWPTSTKRPQNQQPKAASLRPLESIDDILGF